MVNAHPQRSVFSEKLPVTTLSTSHQLSELMEEHTHTVQARQYLNPTHLLAAELFEPTSSPAYREPLLAEHVADFA